MKKKHLTAVLALSLVMAPACRKTETPEKDGTDPSVLPEFSVSMEDDGTKTALSGHKVVWSEGDMVSIFVGTANDCPYYVKEGCGGGSTTTLVAKSPNRDEHGTSIGANVAYFPGDNLLSGEKKDGKYVLGVSVPEKQTYTADDTFSPDAMPMVAVSSSDKDCNLSFKNLLGVLKLRMKFGNTTVRSISVKGNAGEKLAGRAYVTCSHTSEPTIEFVEGSSCGEMTLECRDGGVDVGEDYATFYIALPPCTFTKGLTATFYTSEGSKIERKTDQEITIPRSTIVSMPGISDEPGPEFDDRTIVIAEPGTLSSAISLEDIRKIKNLKLVGEMNADDIAMMTSSFRALDKTLYKTETLDLSEASFPDDILYGFNGLANLKSVKLPPSIKKIRGGTGAFDGCTSLTDVDFGENPKLKVIGSSIWQNINSINSGASALIFCGAFSNCTSLKEISIPESVTTIEGGAFYGSGIEKVNFAPNCSIESLDGFRVSYMDRLGRDQYFLIGTFYGCEHLKTIEIPSSVILITESAFTGWTGLEEITIPETVKYLTGESLFSNCRNLKTAHFPKSFTEIGKSMFSGCGSLVKLDFAGGIKSIKSQAFKGCTSLETIDIEGVSDIERGAFSGCGFTHIRIPDSMTTIPGALFSDCSMLKDVDFNKTETIGAYAFSSCQALTEITLPKTVASVENYAFSSCDNLETVTIQGDTVVLKAESFESFDAKKDLKFKIAQNVKSLITNSEIGVFYGRKITSMDMFIFEPGSQCEEFGLLAHTDVSDDINLPQHITKLGPYAFAQCANIETLDNILRHIKVIGRAAFFESGLTKANIPEGVEDIGIDAFWRCANLRSFSMPNTVSRIGAGCFEDCGKLYTSTINGGDIVIYGGNQSYGIFSGCGYINSITISKNVRSLSQEMLGSQQSPGVYKSFLLSREHGRPVKEVIFEEGSQCTSIDGPVFAFANAALENIVLPEGLRHIGLMAFYKQTNLKMKILGNLKYVGSYALNGCTLEFDEDLIFPADFEGLGREPFGGKHEFNTITINSTFAQPKDCGNSHIYSLKYYSAKEWILNVPIDETFTKWLTDPRAYMKKLSVAEGIEHIADNGFYTDWSPEIITLPSTIKSIGKEAFSEDIREIYCKAVDPPSLAGRLYSEFLTIYVPRTSVDKYKTAANWSAYADKIQPYDF